MEEGCFDFIKTPLFVVFTLIQTLSSRGEIPSLAGRG